MFQLALLVVMLVPNIDSALRISEAPAAQSAEATFALRALCFGRKRRHVVDKAEKAVLDSRPAAYYVAQAR